MAEKQVSKRGRPVGTRMATVELDTLSFKAPKEFVARVRQYSKDHRQSVSEMVREGLTRYLEDDPLSYRYGTVASGETAYEGNTGNTQGVEVGVEFLHGMLSALVDEVRQLRNAVQALEQRIEDTRSLHTPSVTGNTGNTFVDGDIPVASREAQSASGQAPVRDDTRESIPPYDRAKHHLGKLCKRGHEWGNTEQSLKNADNQCLECKALAKREKDAKKRAEREAQPVSG